MPITAVEDGTACSAADRFTKLYYDAQDRKRNKMNFLYVQDAQLVWNGQLIQGAEEIAKFWESLPNSSHTLALIWFFFCFVQETNSLYFIKIRDQRS